MSGHSTTLWGFRIRRHQADASLPCDRLDRPGQMGGHRPVKLAAWRDWLMERIGKEPDITTRELADELAERGLVVSHVSVWNLLKREHQSHKKKRAGQRAG